MRRAKKSLDILHPEGRRYSCRDCPARCCTSSFGIPVSNEERARILADDEARGRLNERALGILRAGILPVVEKGEGLACVFLDDDLRCSLHKRRGHDFLPANCQVFPFRFSQNEAGKPVAILSRYCPSIRDNYGDPVEAILPEKWRQAGASAPPIAEKMGLRSGRVLPRAQYIQVVATWETLLHESPDAPAALARIYDLTDAFDEALPQDKRPNDSEVAAALDVALRAEPEPLGRGQLKFSGRLLFGYLLGGLCYPSRVLLAHRLRPITFWERLRAWTNRLQWIFAWGRVRLLFVDAPVRLRRAHQVTPFLRGPLGRLVSEFLLEVLNRRQGMARQTYLSRVLVDLALMTAVISRYARAAASVEASGQVEERHIREGIGIAELLFSLQTDAGQSAVLQHLRLVLMSNRDDFRRLLAAEV